MNKYFEIIKSNIPEEDLEIILNDFKDNLPWTQDSYNFSGKIIVPKRKTCMYGKNYTYSGQTKIAIPYQENGVLNGIKEYLERVLSFETNTLNGCLLNLYEDGDASISYHTDDEKEMDLNYPIVVLSLGATRQFLFKDIETKEVIKTEIKNGEILLMYPGCQSKYFHSIPKEKNVNKPRISLTFRKFK